MSDLGALSDADLTALYNKPTDLSKMSDADLTAAYQRSAPVGRGEDAAKSIGAGLGNATISTLGALGDYTDYGAKGLEYATNYITDKLGVERYEPPRPRSTSILNYIPTSESIRATVKDPIVSPDYEPKYWTGDVLKTGAELASAIGNPEVAAPGALRALGIKALKNVAAPAAASATLGELGEGTALEGPLRMGGALLGGYAAGKTANMLAERSARAAATPSLAAVKSAADTGYDATRSRTVANPLPQGQATLDNVVDNTITALNNKGIRPSNAGPIHEAIKEIKTPATAGAPDVADLVAGRQSLKELLGRHDTNKAGAFVAINKVEQAIEQASPGTMAKIREADKNWAAVKANEALDKKIARAELRAAGADSGMNLGNKVRQKVADFLVSNEARFLSAENKADLESIVRGTPTQNAVRWIGNHLSGIGSITGAISGYETGGFEGAAAGALAMRGLGQGIKAINNRSVANQAQRVAENIRMRSPLGQQTPLLLPPSINPLLVGLRPALLANHPKENSKDKK